MDAENGEIATKWLSQALGLKDGDTPFPWQLTVLGDFQNGKLWPALDIPTGLGKTSVMAIWLVARALGAPLPRRIIYVVDRRAVVDQATEVALALRKFVEQTPEVKNQLGIADRSLPVSTLRGQYVDNREWLDAPAVPAIIVGTVDMIGSRLLFQGYGVSRKMRPYHAGLIGADTLVVLDEAHLVPAFENLLARIANSFDLFGPRDKALRTLVPPFRLMSLSATGRGGAATAAFRLRQEDLKHPEIDRRLKAPKRVTVHHLQNGEDLVSVLAEKAWKLANNAERRIRCIVFCDRREDAVKTKEEIEKRARGDKKMGTQAVEIDTELFVGGRRVFERQDAAERLESLGFLAGKTIQRSRPAFLFATSAAEVGVDLDADSMVCDLVHWERMVQRLGRVNRRGDVPGGAEIFFVVKQPPAPDKRTQEVLNKKPEERGDKERKAVEKWEAAIATQRALQKPLELLCWHGSTADASTGAIRELNERAERSPVVQQALAAATTPAPLRPALTTAVVGAWAMTSLESHPGRPAIDPWLRGWIENDPPQTEVVWRTYLPVREGGPAKTAGTKREMEAFFEAAPPHTSESLETETFRVGIWLAARAKALLTVPNPGTPAGESSRRHHREDVVAIVLTKSGKVRSALRLKELNTDKDGREELSSVLAGATLIIDAGIAGLKDGLLDNKETAPPRTADDGDVWMQSNSSGAKLEHPVVSFRVHIGATRQSTPADKEWRERLRFAVEVSDDGEPMRWLTVEKWRNDSANEEDRSAGSRQVLEEHRSWAEERARALAKTLNLPEQYEEMLCAAAFLHDEGKRARRWQRAFNAPAGEESWAKTEGPINYALLDGYRHEFGSIIAVETHERLQRLPEDLRDLAMHVIAAHHGFARPFIETRGCDAAPPSVLEPYAKSIALRFEKLQQRWGPWGLAWWESLLRAVDQRASRDNDARDIRTVAVVRTGGA
jgi:CRISPR-associated endonuclease/helicase Cas3